MNSTTLGNIEPFPVNDGVVDLANAEVRYKEGGRCALSQREVQLLSFLAHRPGVPISRDELLAEVWRVDPARIITRTVDMHMSNLRHKLRDSPHHPALLTVRGHGYMLAQRSGDSV
jgi:DNA-binding response OmpR family regulator